MSRISESDIAHLANLTRLEHHPERDALYAEQLSAVVDYVAQLEQVQAAAHNQEYVATVYRQDVVREAGSPLSDLREELVAGAPRRDGQYIAVRAVFAADEGGES